MKEYDVIVIGGGPAGLAASISAAKKDVKVCLIEREAKLGGILKQCIHDGFGLQRFKEKLSGPEYAWRYIDEFNHLAIDCLLLSFVTKIVKEDGFYLLTIVNQEGISHIKTKALIFATGCRERTPRQVGIHGERPAGVYTAGNSQNFINLLGQRVARRAVILGSGDIGLIMARRLTLEGTKVLGVYEIMNVPSGLPRNVTQCLKDYNIPLHLSTTVTRVFGQDHVSAVEVAEVDEKMQVIEDSKEIIECDALIVSVGLIPENELAETLGVTIDPKTKGPALDKNYMTNLPGVFACGNCFHVYDLVDYVSKSGEEAGNFAAAYVKGELKQAEPMVVNLPKKKAFDPNKLICIGCPNSCELSVKEEKGNYLVSGNKCLKGEDFAISELSNPKRSVCSTVKTIFSDNPVVSVRTSNDIPKSRIFDVMQIINSLLVVDHHEVGDVLIKNVCELDADIIITTKI